MWTAQIVSKELRNGVAFVTVDFTDGTNTAELVYSTPEPTDAWLQSNMEGDIARLTQASNFVESDPVLASVPTTAELQQAQAQAGVGTAQAGDPLV